MKCSDADRILPDLIDGTAVDGAGISGAQDLEFQSHLKTCSHCSELLADLKLIASEARQLSNTEEPDPRVWLRIAAQLRAEGVIRDPKPAVVRPALVPARQRRWNALWFAPVAVAILAAGSYVLNHKPTLPVTQPVAKKAVEQQPEVQPAQQAVAQQQPAPQPVAPASKAPDLQVAKSSPEPAETSPPAEDDQQFLTDVSTSAPAMRATYQNQLNAVNTEIEETRAYIKRYPGDVDARQHLMEVYQQKAMLYQIALDRIQ